MGVPAAAEVRMGRAGVWGLTGSILSWAPQLLQPNEERGSPGAAFPTSVVQRLVFI